MEQLKLQRHRNSTQRNYYSVWKTFNKFYIKLDKKPVDCETRIVLFVAHLVTDNKKSTTIRSYLSAIKAILADHLNIRLNQDQYLINSLTRACKLKNDSYRVRLPVQKDLLQIMLKKIQQHFLAEGQIYLMHLYMAMISTAYYGLFRVSEITHSEHTIKAADVSIGINKCKLMFILRSTKTLYKSSKPQVVKISATSKTDESSTGKEKYFCPYQLLNNYRQHRSKLSDREEEFFVFKDKSVVTAEHFRYIFKIILKLAGFDERLYGTHSLCAGRSIDLLEMGFSVETIKKMGRWKSNAVYAYLR